MANTLKNFLVGIGFDYDKQGEQQISSGINSIKSTVLQLGAVVAGGFGVKALTTDFANSKDEIGKFTEVFGAIPADIQAFGQALAHQGGSLDSFMGQVQALAQLRAGAKAGDVGFLGQLGRFGVDGQSILDAESAVEAYTLIADQFAQLDREQRIGAAGVLGFDEASIRLLSNGTEELRKIVAEEKQVRLVTTEMTTAAKEFNDELQRSNDLMGGFADQVSVGLLPEITKQIEGMNNALFLLRNVIKEDISTGIEHLFYAVPPSIQEKREQGQVIRGVIDRSNAPVQGAMVGTIDRSEAPDNDQASTSSTSRNAPQPIRVEATLTLDGRAIDKKIIDVVAGEAQVAIDDLQNSTRK